MDLRELLSAKESVKEKLEKLEHIKSDIREAVYDKIKAEYTEKMTEIDKAIDENKLQVEEELSSIKEEIAEVNSFLEKYESEYEEISVRIQIGEFSEDEYGEKRDELKKQIDMYIMRQKELKQKMAELGVTGDAEELEESSLDDTQKEEDIESVFDEISTLEEKPDFSTEIVEDETDVADNTEPEIMPDFNAEITESEAVDLSEKDKDDAAFELATDLTPDVEEEKNPFEDALKDPINDILQPIITEEFNENENSDGIQPIETNLNEFFNAAEENDEEQNDIEGITCPKCGHVNNPNLMNCEKCGAELF